MHAKAKKDFFSHLLALSEGTEHCLSLSKTFMHAPKKPFFHLLALSEGT